MNAKGKCQKYRALFQRPLISNFFAVHNTAYSTDTKGNNDVTCSVDEIQCKPNQGHFGASYTQQAKKGLELPSVILPQSSNVSKS